MIEKLRKLMTAVMLSVALLAGCTAGVAGVSTESTESGAVSTTEVQNMEQPETEPGETDETKSDSGTESEPESQYGIETESQSEMESENGRESENGTEHESEIETESETETEAVTVSEPAEPELLYHIKVDRKANCVTIYAKDSSGEYTVPIKYMICSVGVGRRTPTGVFAISDQYRWRELFNNSYGQYASRITGHILFHSVPYFTPSQDSLIPGTYNQLGTKASQGCVRLACSDAKWIYDNCPPGTTVEIYDGPTASVPERPKGLVIAPNSPYSGWDPTDPSSNNPWKTVPITINGAVDLTVECGSELDLLSHVSALDIDGSSPLSVTVSGNVNVNECGTYTIVYSAVGAIGTTAAVQATVTVIPMPETEADTEEPTEEPEMTEEDEITAEAGTNETGVKETETIETGTTETEAIQEPEIPETGENVTKPEETTEFE